MLLFADSLISLSELSNLDGVSFEVTRVPSKCHVRHPRKSHGFDYFDESDDHGGWLSSLVRVHGRRLAGETKPEGSRGKIHIWPAVYPVALMLNQESFRADAEKARSYLIRCSRENDNENVSVVSPMAMVSNDISLRRVWRFPAVSTEFHTPQRRTLVLQILEENICSCSTLAEEGGETEKCTNVRIEVITR